MLSINVEPAKKMRRHYLIATVLLAAVGLCLFLFSGNETAYENDRYPSSGAIDAADIEAADKREAPIELAWPAPHTPLAAEAESAPAPPLAEVSDDALEGDRSEEATEAWKSLRTLGSPRLEVRIVKFLEFNPVDQLRPEQVVGLTRSISLCALLARSSPEDIERRHSELYFSGASESDIYFLDEMCEGVTIDHVAMAYQWLLSAAESGDMR